MHKNTQRPDSKKLVEVVKEQPKQAQIDQLINKEKNTTQGKVIASSNVIKKSQTKAHQQP